MKFYDSLVAVIFRLVWPFYLDTDIVSLFLDIGTNAEIVVGNREWFACAACSASVSMESAANVLIGTNTKKRITG